MPALPDVAKVLRVAFGHTYSINTSVLVRQYYEYSGAAPTPTQATTFAGSCASSWASHCAALAHESVYLTSVEVTDLSSPSSAQGIVAVSDQGSKTGHELTADACLVEALLIGRRYRGGHPRSYWPFGESEDLSYPQQWLGAFLTSCNTGLAALHSAIEGDGWSGAGTLQLVSVPYYKGFTVVTNPVTGRARNVPTVQATPVPDVVTGIVSRENVGSQRRRLHP